MICAALTAAALAIAAPAGAQPAVGAQAVDPAAQAIAERLMEVMEVGKQLDQMFEMMSPMMAKSALAQLEAGQSSRAMFEQIVKGDYGRKQKLEAIFAEEFLAAMRTQLPRLKREYAREYAATFSVGELNALVAFFSDGAGAKFVAETPGLQARLSATSQRIGIEVGMVAAPKAIERAQSELGDIKP